MKNLNKKKTQRTNKRKENEIVGCIMGDTAGTGCQCPRAN
jgi:hypothetical protein